MEEQKKNPAQGLSESEQVQVRRQKLADLQAAGHDPFTLTKYPQDAYSADLKEEFKDLPNETDSGKQVALAGRMMSKRVMGKASFAHLRDDKGDIQLYVRRDELGDEPYAAFKKLDVGDIIGVKGEVFRTKTGELSVRATELTLLAKSLRPLPEKFHGLTDTEMRYRQRYVDLIANPEVKDTFVKRSQILKEIRAYLDEKGFLEVDTPILTPFEIGASARPFYTHHNSLNMDMVLRIVPQVGKACLAHYALGHHTASQRHGLAAVGLVGQVSKLGLQVGRVGILRVLGQGEGVVACSLQVGQLLAAHLHLLALGQALRRVLLLFFHGFSYSFGLLSLQRG